MKFPISELLNEIKKRFEDSFKLVSEIDEIYGNFIITKEKRSSKNCLNSISKEISKEKQSISMKEIHGIAQNLRLLADELKDWLNLYINNKKNELETQYS